jgi:hypothetical protein
VALAEIRSPVGRSPEEYPCGVLEFLEHGGGLRPPNLDGDGDLEPVAAFFSGSCPPS